MGEKGKIAIINPNLSVFLPINIIYSMQVSERFLLPVNPMFQEKRLHYI